MTVSPTPGSSTDPISTDVKLGDTDHGRLRLLAEQLTGGIDPLLQGSLDMRSILEVTSEFYALERWLAHVPPGIFVCGAARLQKNHLTTGELNEDWRLTSAVGNLLAQRDVSCFTGGGPGSMAAASEGAANAGGTVVGICIKLKHEEEPNPHMTHQIKLKYFFPRKCGLVRKTAGAVITPGGMGTLDEAFECVTFANELARTGEIYPVAFVGDMYKPLEHWLRHDPNGPVKRGYMADLPEYVKFFTDEKEATEFVLEKGKNRLERLRSRALVAQKEEPMDQNEELAMAILGGLFDEAHSQSSSVIMDPRMVFRSAKDYVEVLKNMRSIDRSSTALIVGGEPASFSHTQDPNLDIAARVGYALKALNQNIIIGAPLGFPGQVADTIGKYHSIVTQFDLNDLDRMPSTLLTKGTSHSVDYGFTQRTASLNGSSGAIVFPGGIRTLDLLCELWNLKMCHKISDDYKFSLVDKAFWSGFISFLDNLATQEGARRRKGDVEHLGYMDKDEVALPLITDNASEAVNYISKR